MSYFTSENRVFRVEVQFSQTLGNLTQFPFATPLHEGRVLLKIPYARLQTEIQRVKRLGGSILNIHPFESELESTTPPVSQFQESSPTEALPVSELPQPEASSPVSVPEKPLEAQSPTPTEVSTEPWWVEIFTEFPRCLYYFGPFESAEEAKAYQPGYVEDLEGEDSQGIVVKIRQCSPQILTQEL